MKFEYYFTYFRNRTSMFKSQTHTHTHIFCIDKSYFRQSLNTINSEHVRELKGKFEYTKKTQSRAHTHTYINFPLSISLSVHVFPLGFTLVQNFTILAEVTLFSNSNKIYTCFNYSLALLFIGKRGPS